MDNCAYNNVLLLVLLLFLLPFPLPSFFSTTSHVAWKVKCHQPNPTASIFSKWLEGCRVLASNFIFKFQISNLTSPAPMMNQLEYSSAFSTSLHWRWRSAFNARNLRHISVGELIVRSVVIPTALCPPGDRWCVHQRDCIRMYHLLSHRLDHLG